MKLTWPVRAPKAGASLLLWAFAVLILGFALAGIIGIFVMRSTQTRVQRIAERTLTSIELASELSRNINKRRLLVAAHIIETDLTTMKLIKEELNAAASRIDSISSAYEATIANDYERAQWLELRKSIVSVRPRTERVIALSTRNLDDQAREAMREIESDFDAIDQATEALVRINRSGADQEIDRIRALHRGAVVTLVILGLAWTSLALATARWVVRMIREREHEMARARELLEERNRDLDAFAGRVAHDLRGPLTTINLSASLLSRQTTLESDPSRILLRGVNQMERTIEALLTLSRISGQVTGATCRTASVMSTVEEDLRPNLDAVGGLLRIEVAAASVSCNEGFLRQILWNLCENAVKYRRTEVPLEVAIRGRITPQAYEFCVSDNGLGMSPSEVQQAFDPFFRGKQAQSKPGTGLGLSIVKRAIEASGGSIAIDSTPERGTTFKILLPLADSQAA